MKANLKFEKKEEPCHEDFAVLGPFYAKIILFEALIINKMLL